MDIYNMSVTYMQSIEWIHWKLKKGVDFTKYALSPIIQYVHGEKIGEVKKCCKFDISNFLGIRLLHAHLQYVCNIHAKYWMNTLKAEEGVDCTKYAL